MKRFSSMCTINWVSPLMVLVFATPSNHHCSCKIYDLFNYEKRLQHKTVCRFTIQYKFEQTAVRKGCLLLHLSLFFSFRMTNKN